MRRNIFLTSMLALAVASPAFADWPVGVGVYQNNGYIGALDSNDNAVENANCQATPLTYNSNAPGSGTFTFTAQWSPKPYTITYKPGTAGGTAVPGTDVVKGVSYHGTTYSDTSALKTLPGSTFTAPTGYVFSKWQSNNDVTGGTLSSTTEYNENTSISPYNVAGDTEMTALWTAKTGLKIIYAPGTARNLNGDTSAAHIHTPTAQSGAATSQDVTYNTTTPGILSNMYSVPGYEFVKWMGDYNASGTATPYTDATHTGGTQYTIGDTFTYKVDGDLTLTAMWQPKKYNVIYDKGAHPRATAPAFNGYTDPEGAEYDKDYSVLPNSTTGVAAADGYEFCGWSTNSAQTCNSPTDANSWKWTGETPWHETSDLTVYAIYSANLYSVTFDCNNASAGGTAPGARTNKTVGTHFSDMPTTKESCTQPTGNDFSYWECKRTDNGTVVYNSGSDNGAMDMPASNVECKAHWGVNSYSLYYNCCTGSGGTNPETESYDYGDSVTPLTGKGSCGDDPIGKHFVSWDCSGLDGDATNGYTMPAHAVTCNAVCDPNVINLRWNRDNGSAVTDGTCTYNTDPNTNDNGISVPATPTKTGYDFVGWQVTYHE